LILIFLSINPIISEDHLEITLKNNSEREIQTKRQLERLIEKHKLSQLMLSASFATSVLNFPEPQNNLNAVIENSPSIGSRLTPREVKRLLELHNQIRADVGVDEVTWSGELATYAQEWADHLVDTSCDLEHRPGSGKWELKYGENLFVGSSRYFDVTSAVRAWEEEKKDYDGQAIDRHNKNKSGHYTQMVWKTTRQIGCAKAECRRRIIVVCNYDPPGNELGRKPY
jgi:pathogenesis-related protein 1